ncbi:MAG: hypothetical protein K2G07_05705, partial [Muribaculaceae bacterium]|nr:hypothetical protein [Muribaculaceae bacterium]
LPPYKDDLLNTRTTFQTNTKGCCFMPQLREEYEQHLSLINKSGLRFVVLWQDIDNIISKKQLDYYTSLGASGFTIANDVNAKIIKDYNPNVLVICSIVQKTQQNIKIRDFSSYDYIILYYPFNRSINALRELGDIKDKLVLMPNSLCHIDCPSSHHWFPKNQSFNHEIECWLQEKSLDKSGFIFPEHLYLFDDLVGGYKLQGREYPTEAIKYLCHFYFEGEYYENFVSPFLSDDMAKKLYDLAHTTNVVDYYNIYSNKLILNL